MKRNSAQDQKRTIIHQPAPTTHIQAQHQAPQPQPHQIHQQIILEAPKTAGHHTNPNAKSYLYKSDFVPIKAAATTVGVPSWKKFRNDIANSYQSEKNTAERMVPIVIDSAYPVGEFRIASNSPRPQTVQDGVFGSRKANGTIDSLEILSNGRDEARLGLARERVTKIAQSSILSNLAIQSNQ